MAIVFKAPKSTLNTTSKQIQNVDGNCPPCPEPVLEGKELNYTQNGEYTVTPEQGVDGFSSIDVTVNVPSDVNNQNKTVSPSTSSQSVSADSGYTGLGMVTVNPVTSSIDANIQPENILSGVTILGVSGTDEGYDAGYTDGETAGHSAGYAEGEADGIVEGIAEQKAKLTTLNVSANGNYTREDGYDEVNVDVQPNLTVGTITQNGGYAPFGYDGYSRVEVNVLPNLETKGVTYTSNDTYTITPDAAMDGLARVNVTVNVPSDINNQNKTVNPSTSSQSISADSGYSGLGTVTVNAVTSSIDQNIAAGNIKSGVSILGVTGNYDPQPDLQAKTVNPSTSQQTVTPDQGKDGLSSVTVTAVTAAIDSNIQAENILSGVTILGVEGTDEGYDTGYTEGEAAGYQTGYDEGYSAGQAECPTPTFEQLDETITENGSYNYSPEADGFDAVDITVNVQPDLEAKTATYVANNTYTITPTVGKDGISQATITVAVPSDIHNQNKTVNPSTSQQTVTADSGYSGLGTVTVNAVTAAIDANIVAENILNGVEILGVTGSDMGYDTGYVDGYAQGQAECPTPTATYVNETITDNGTYVYDPSDYQGDSFDYFSGVEITVDVSGEPTLQDKTVTPTTSQQIINADAGYDGLDTVTVNAVTSAIDQNIVAGNIKNGVTILGVQGSYSGGSCTVFDPVGYDCSDLNALFGNGVTTSASVQPGTYGFSNTDIMFAPKASYVQNSNTVFHYSECGNLLTFAGCSIRYNSITPGTVISQGIASMFHLDDALLSAVGEIELLDSDGEKITDPLWANSMFYGCSKLINVDLTINPIANAAYMFYSCYNINSNIMDWVEDQDFTYCSNYQAMFEITGTIGFPTATIAPDIDMSAATNVNRMFFYNNYSGASDMGWLVTVPQYNWGSVTNVESAFDGQYKITTLGGFINLGKAFSSNNPNGHTLDLSGATGLTKQSIMNVINNLSAPDDTNVNDATLKLSATSYALLDASDIAVATAKNWSVISA